MAIDLTAAVGKAVPFSSVPADEVDWRRFAQWLTDGVVALPDPLTAGRAATSLQVFGDSSGRQVKVRAGQVQIKGHNGWLLAEGLLPIAANASGSSRIDLVVARATWALDAISIDVVTGTPGSGVAPTPVNSGSIIEVPLAEVVVANGAVTITSGNVTNRRPWAVPLNGAGGLIGEAQAGANLSINSVVGNTGTELTSLTIYSPPGRSLRWIAYLGISTPTNPQDVRMWVGASGTASPSAIYNEAAQLYMPTASAGGYLVAAEQRESLTTWGADTMKVGLNPKQNGGSASTLAGGRAIIRCHDMGPAL